MKNPVELHHHSENPIATQLLQQFAEREGEKRRSATNAKKNPLLVPFLLTIPVILIVAILGLSWMRESQANTTGFTLESQQVAEAEQPLTMEPGNRRVISSQATAEIVAGKDTVVKSKRVARGTAAQHKPYYPGAEVSDLRLEELVKIQPEYRVRKGQIQNLKLHIANLSPAVLDLVAIEVNYLDKISRVLKKETLYLKDIAAGKAAIATVPDAGNSYKLAYKVSLVSAKDANLYLVSR